MLKDKKPSHKNIKCFQLSCVAWSNLYRGKVARNAIDQKIIKSDLNTTKI